MTASPGLFGWARKYFDRSPIVFRYKWSDKLLDKVIPAGFPFKFVFASITLNQIIQNNWIIAVNLDI